MSDLRKGLAGPEAGEVISPETELRYETEVWRVDPASPDSDLMRRAGQILKEGGLVAFPTETVYGLGGDALDPEASRKIYAAKGRPSDNPLIVHIADLDDLYEIASEVPEKAVKLAKACWPGPLTMIFNKTDIVPYQTTGGLDTVAVRFPDHPVALALIREGGRFVAGPSANTSGRPSPTRAEHVYEDLNGRIPLILDAGEVRIGLESTIVDFTEEIPVILRPGYLDEGRLREILGDVKMDPGLVKPDDTRRPKAPGMRYRHYAPKAAMTVVRGEREKVVTAISELTASALSDGKKVGLLITEETAEAVRDVFGKPAESAASAGVAVSGASQPGGKEDDRSGDINPFITVIGHRDSEDEIAHNLFAALRDFDAAGVDEIYSEAYETPRLGDAVMNRLLKAAGHRVLNV